MQTILEGLVDTLSAQPIKSEEIWKDTEKKRLTLKAPRKNASENVIS